MTKESEKPNFRWESGYEKTWEAIREDESGSLVTNLEQLVKDAHAQLRIKRRRLKRPDEAGYVRLGMMRHLFLIIDLSSAMDERDLKPNRLLCTIKCASKFVEDYFDQNPTSQLGIIAMLDTKAERITELSGSPVRHLTALQSLAKRQCVGEPSLQNALTMAESRLRFMPSHSSREIVILVGSLTTCDPSDIHQTIQSLITNHIRCTVISLAVEVFVYKALGESTKGASHVVLDSVHLRSLLQDIVPPPIASEENEANLIRIGFPHSKPSDNDLFPIKKCICHLPSAQNASGSVCDSVSTASYTCPRCNAVYCELPVECSICGITLVAAPHLARAYHHLFPLPTFSEKPTSKNDCGQSTSLLQGLYCAGCNLVLGVGIAAYQCPKCNELFCADCDAFLHDSVHSCPTCTI